jgi:hypothetical protein
MADVDTIQLSAEHGAIRHDIAVESARLGNLIGSEACGIRAGQGDIRRETALGFGDTRYNIASNAGDIRREVANEACRTNGAVKDARHDVLAGVDASKDFLASQADSNADRVVDRVSELRGTMSDRFFDVGRDTQDIRAQVISAQQQVQAGFLGASKDAEINALKTQIEMAKQTTYLSDKIDADGEKTRGLLNDLKYHDLNRGLVERHASLVECEADRNHWRHRADQSQYQGQWAALQNQIQAFGSQLSSATQGMVNFGTMAGVGQTSSQNNV